ncbi:zinc-binding dehydrogenase [Puia dinghuensis]|uniref:Alcohol dehydrogenase n=1 Tax=Puia dinghuensis TaxID=1792502 RepID=A0A8J2UDA9_9BACT|nr:zinc-binding dehydrogenase [Puia dinghuensis]GGB01760.1 alcohol dehydrogenase [Puia dinghuensis]
MKALVITEKNKPVELLSVADKVAAAGQALVKVYAAALNHRDVWIQKGQYAGLKFPIIPGSDGAGVVISGGDWTGKEVIIDPALHWGDAPGYQSPTDFHIVGLPDDGTLAEYVVVPVANLVDKPAHLSFEEAAALPLAGVTAYRASMVRGQVRAGERVLITGIGGGVALFALQFAVAAGAKVYVTSGSDEKLARAKAMGALGGVNYRTPDWAAALRAQAGAFDVIVDGAGGDGMNDLLDLATPGGRLVFYGSTRGNPSSVVLRRIFWKQLNVLGSTMGSPADFAAMVDFVGQHGIRPVVDRVFAMDEGEAAFRYMDEGMQFGKIVIRI